MLEQLLYHVAINTGLAFTTVISLTQDGAQPLHLIMLPTPLSSLIILTDPWPPIKIEDLPVWDLCKPMRVIVPWAKAWRSHSCKFPGARKSMSIKMEHYFPVLIWPCDMVLSLGLTCSLSHFHHYCLEGKAQANAGAKKERTDT